MYEQRGDEGRDKPPAGARPDDGLLEASPHGDGFRCYSLEVLRLLED